MISIGFSSEAEAPPIEVKLHDLGLLDQDGRSGDWARVYGFATPDQVMGRIGELMAARQTKTP